jgi:ubiquitin thioesterase protein OTUB1
VAENHPLIGSQEPLANLMIEYRDDPVYFKKMEKLCESYKSLRRVRPDGNCFFRGFGYSFFEKLLSDETEWKSFQTLVSKSKDQLLAQGFPKFTLEDFYDSLNLLFNCIS